MNDPKQPNLPAQGQFLVCPAEDGRTKIEGRLEGEAVWLNEQFRADLFQTRRQDVGQHPKNIFEEGELAENSVVKDFFTTATDGKDYRTNFYNLAIGTSASHQRVKPESLRAMPRALPGRRTISWSTKLVSPMFSASQELRSQIQNLRRTRDLLLPRVLSGEVEVAEREVSA